MNPNTLLEAVYWRARATWSVNDLSLESFCAHVERAGVTPEALQANGDDLFLAFACLEGDASALAHFETACLAALSHRLLRFRLAASEVDEVRQHVRVEMLLGPKARLRKYSGRGSFVGWARIAADRLALDLLRDRRHSLGSPNLLEHLPDLVEGPELAVLRQRDGAILSAALADALAGLGDRYKAVLRLHYVDGLNVDRIGRVFGVHRATVARWLVDIRGQLARQLAQRFQLDHGISGRRLQSLVELLRDDIQGSLLRVLAPGEARSLAPTSAR